MPAPKLVCLDCNAIFNRRNNRNQVRTQCINCGSANIAAVTGGSAGVTPPSGSGTATQGGGGSGASAIPTAPPLPPARPGASPPPSAGGGITPQALAEARRGLRRMVRPPVVLPGAAHSPIPRGVRVLAHGVRNTEVGWVTVCTEWSATRNGPRELIYARVNRDLAPQLAGIAAGIVNPGHANANTRHGNAEAHMPTRRGNRRVRLPVVRYYEYGWRTLMHPGTQWQRQDANGMLRNIPARENSSINFVVQRFRGGETFSERLLIAETGEVFYTPDHYETFYRYHPGTQQWYRYEFQGSWATGPGWDESFYDDRYG